MSESTVLNPVDQHDPDQQTERRRNIAAVWGWRSLFSATKQVYMGNDCFHYPTSITTGPGLTYAYKKDSSGNKYTDNSSVIWEYEYGAPSNASIWQLWSIISEAPFRLILELITQLGSQMYRSGWWAVLWLSLIHI